MNRLKNFTWALSILLMITACSDKVSLEGAWYGLYNKSLVTLTFGADSTLSVKSECFSSLSMQCRYSVNVDTAPMEIDLKPAQDGLSGAGIFRINTDQTLELNCDFGTPQTLKRPTEINSQPAQMTNIYFKVTRNKEEVMAALTPDIQIPESASLAFERNKRLGSGINLNAVVDGNLHPGYERDAPLSDAEIKAIAETGFQSVRLPVCWSKHALMEAPYTIDPKFLAKVDRIINQCLMNGLAVSIDMHYYPYINFDFTNDPVDNYEQEYRNRTTEQITFDENFDRLYSFWEQLGEHYKDYPPELYFDLLNEPNMRLGADKWNEVIGRLVKIIRKTNPDRTLLVATPNLGQSWTLNYLELPEDDWNLIVEFHYYLPHLFTHQGLSYAQAGESHNVSWMGTPQEKEAIISDLDFCQRWSETHGRPVNMGEYGVVNTADEASRARYLGFVHEEAVKRGISSQLWGYRECFQIRDEKTGEWIQPILDALKLGDKD